MRIVQASVAAARARFAPSVRFSRAGPGRGLGDLAMKAAAKVGEVSVDVGNSACKVPNSLEHIQNARESGAIGKKRKTVKC